MAWLQVETVLVRHRKIGKLATVLNISRHEAIGHLICLWAHVLELAEDGDISKWTEKNISEYAEWNGDPQAFFKALVNDGDGWIDVRKNGKFIHDWYDYTSRYLKTRYRTSNPEKLERLKSVFSRTKVRLQSDDRTDKTDNIYIGHFEDLWTRYPCKVGKKMAQRMFKGSVKNEKDVSDIRNALENYINSKRVREGYVQNGDTWFNNWRDWINFTEPEVTKPGGSWDR